MLNFLENHDEQRFASDFFGGDASKTFAPLYVSLFLNTAPFMVYFGEEVGEKGMDEEGFSGCDGRTTIFDWWSVGAIRRLRKMISSGAYTSGSVSALVKAGLKKDEAQHFLRFSEAIRLASEDPAIRMGTTYDLCYCNMSSDGFDKNRHYAFLRDYEDHTILIVANFSRNDAVMKLTIPEHAFEWMGIPATAELHPGSVIEVHVPATDAAVITLI
jgi:glycosidase